MPSSPVTSPAYFDKELGLLSHEKRADRKKKKKETEVEKGLWRYHISPWRKSYRFPNYIYSLLTQLLYVTKSGSWFKVTKIEPFNTLQLENK